MIEKASRIIPEARGFCIMCTEGIDSNTENSNTSHVHTARNLACVMRMSAQLGDSPARQRALLSEYLTKLDKQGKVKTIKFLRQNLGLKTPK